MKKIWQTSSLLLLLAILLVLVVAGVGLYYYYFEFTTTTTAKEATTTSVQKGDFLLQASVGKAEYRYDEPVTLNFKLTYLGKSPAAVYMYPGCLCVIGIKNATESLNIHYPAGIAGTSLYDFTPGQYITGAVVINGGDIQYRSDSGGGTLPLISDKPFSGFSPGGSYYIQVTTNIYLNATEPRFSPGTELTTSSLHITIKHR